MLWRDLKKPIIALAPMYGVTDSAFRLLCKKFGADLVFSEMQIADSIVYAYQKNDQRLKQKIASGLTFEQEERPIILQIAGNDPNIVGEAAKIMEKNFFPDGIDFNLGCPAKSARKNLYGASMLADRKELIKIVRSLRKATKLPLSIKLRSGIEKDDEIIKIAKLLEDEGINLLSIHGRTLKQGYKGSANWQIIYKVAQKVEIPVLGSGDMLTPEKVKCFLENPIVAGVLIARGAIGRPQIFSEVKSLVEGKTMPKFSSLEIVKEHAQLAWQKKGARGLKELRKHLKAYFAYLPGSKNLRLKLMQIEDLHSFLKILDSFSVLDRQKKKV